MRLWLAGAPLGAAAARALEDVSGRQCSDVATGPFLNVRVECHECAAELHGRGDDDGIHSADTGASRDVRRRLSPLTIELDVLNVGEGKQIGLDAVGQRRRSRASTDGRHYFNQHRERLNRLVAAIRDFGEQCEARLVIGFLIPEGGDDQ